MWSRAKKFRENGDSTFITLLLLLPILVGAFGLGMDIAYAGYMKTSLQESLDNATVTVARQQTGDKSLGDSRTSGGRTYVPFDDTKSVIKDRAEFYYEQSANQHPNLNLEDRSITTSVRYLPKDSTTGRDVAPVVTAKVKETSNTFFLRTIGIPTVTYKLESQARMGYEVDLK